VLRSLFESVIIIIIVLYLTTVKFVKASLVSWKCPHEQFHNRSNDSDQFPLCNACHSGGAIHH